ncbi:hypothetical protein [Bacteroides sp. f07]|uniref:hypothetical protein n=1 Tax=Bacteroides sp. f07 TaxID=3132704 RepID=UPI0036F1CF8A
MRIKRLISFMVCWLALYSANGQVQWEQVEPGVWKGTVGKPEAYSLLGVSGATPLKEGFKRLPEVGLPGLAGQVVGRIEGGRTTLRLPLRKEEQLYGFGLNWFFVKFGGTSSIVNKESWLSVV